MDYNSKCQMARDSYRLINKISDYVKYTEIVSNESINDFDKYDLIDSLSLSEEEIVKLNEDSSQFIKTKLCELESLDVNLDENEINKALPSMIYIGIYQDLDYFNEITEGDSKISINNSYDIVHAFFNNLNDKDQSEIKEIGRQEHAERELEYFNSSKSWDDKCYIDNGSLRAIKLDPSCSLLNIPNNAFYSNKYDKDAVCLAIYHPTMKSMSIAFNGKEIDEECLKICQSKFNNVISNNNHIAVKGISSEDFSKLMDEFADKDITISTSFDKNKKELSRER